MPTQSLALDNLPASESASQRSSSIIAPGLIIAAGSLYLAFSALRKHHALQTKALQVVVGHEPPLPASALPLIDTTAEMLANDHRFYDWLTDLCLEFHGQPFRIKALGLASITMLSSPDHVEQVLRTDFANFEKSEAMAEAMHDLLGDGILTTDGATWYHQHKNIGQLFTLQELHESLCNIVHRRLADLIQQVDHHAETDTAFDLCQLIHDFTLETITEITLGVPLGSLSHSSGTNDSKNSSFHRAFDAAQRQIAFRMTRPAIVWKLQRYLNLAGEASLKEDISIIQDAVTESIRKSLECHKQRNRSQKAPLSVVSHFLDAVETKGPTVNDFDPKPLHDIVLNIMFAGRDTTAQTLAWFFYCITQHPHVANNIRNEIQRLAPELLNQTHNNTFPSMEQVNKLQYLDAAIKETLRLYPAVPLNVRSTLRDTLLADGTLLKAGMLVGLPTYALGRMPHVWGPNATVYDPDRWFDAATGKPRVVSAFQFNAFHGGPRQCIGQQLAMLEMKIVAVAVLTRFDVAVEPGVEVTYARSLTLPMKHPFMVKATHQRPSTNK